MAEQRRPPKSIFAMTLTACTLFGLAFLSCRLSIRGWYDIQMTSVQTKKAVYLLSCHEMRAYLDIISNRPMENLHPVNVTPRTDSYDANSGSDDDWGNSSANKKINSYLLEDLL